MKNEIERILKQEIETSTGYVYGTKLATSKILQLFNDKIDSCEDEIARNILKANLDGFVNIAKRQAKDIIKIIKERCK